MIEKKSRQPRSKERGPGKAGTHRVSFSVSCQPDELTKIKKIAAAKEVTISSLILNAVIYNS